MNFGDIRSRLFDIGVDILNVAVDSVTGVMLAQTGDSVRGTVRSTNAEIWQQPGLSSRPSPAAQGSSASQALTLKCGDRDIIFAQRDCRAANAFGNLDDGETILYATGSDGNGAPRVKLGADGSATLGTTDTGSTGGNAVYIQATPTAIRFVAPWGVLTFDPTGFHVAVDEGPTLDMLALSGLPGPFASFTSAIVMAANGFQAVCNTVQLGIEGALGWTPVTMTPAETGGALPPGSPIIPIGVGPTLACLSPVQVSSSVYVGS